MVFNLNTLNRTLLPISLPSSRANAKWIEPEESPPPCSEFNLIPIQIKKQSYRQLYEDNLALYFKFSSFFKYF